MEWEELVLAARSNCPEWKCVDDVEVCLRYQTKLLKLCRLPTEELAPAEQHKIKYHLPALDKHLQ